MGFDKAKLKYHGVEQVSWLSNLLETYCEKVFVSGSPNKIKGQYDFIEDIYDRGGPMNGILSAFQKFPNNDWLIVPVDMPNLDSDVVEYLIDAHDEKILSTCFKDDSSRLEPFPIILNHASYPLLQSNFNDSKESLYEFISKNNCKCINVPDPNWLKNINTASQS